MIQIQPKHKIQLSHRAYHVVVNSQGHVAAVSPEGAGSIVTEQASVAQRFQVNSRPSSVALSADGTLLAAAGKRGVEILSTSDPTQRHSIPGNVASVEFLSTNRLWSAERVNAEQVLVHLDDIASGASIAKVWITDPYEEAHIDLRPHGEEACVFLSLAAGQNGQSLFEIRFDGRALAVTQVKGFDECVWPAVRQGQRPFLVMSPEDGKLWQYASANGPVLGEMVWPYSWETEQMGDFVTYVDEQHALLMSREGPLFLIELTRMEIVDQVVLPGYTPPTFDEEEAEEPNPPYSTLTYLSRVRDREFVAISQPLDSEESGMFRDEVLFFELDLSGIV